MGQRFVRSHPYRSSKQLIFVFLIKRADILPLRSYDSCFYTHFHYPTIHILTYFHLQSSVYKYKRIKVCEDNTIMYMRYKILESPHLLRNTDHLLAIFVCFCIKIYPFKVIISIILILFFRKYYIWFEMTHRITLYRSATYLLGNPRSASFTRNPLHKGHRT